MGIEAEFFVATDEEASTYGGESDGSFHGLQVRGLTSLELETLRAILDGKEWHPGFPTLPRVRQSGEVWLFKFPAEYVRRLRELDADAIRSASEQWAATEELACLPDDVEPVISALVVLARTIEGDERGLFFWGQL